MTSERRSFCLMKVHSVAELVVRAIPCTSHGWCYRSVARDEISNLLPILICAPSQVSEIVGSIFTNKNV